MVSAKWVFTWKADGHGKVVKDRSATSVESISPTPRS